MPYVTIATGVGCYKGKDAKTAGGGTREIPFENFVLFKLLYSPTFVYLLTTWVRCRARITPKIQPHIWLLDLSAVVWGVTADLQESANLVIKSATISALD